MKKVGKVGKVKKVKKVRVRTKSVLIRSNVRKNTGLRALGREQVRRKCDDCVAAVSDLQQP